MSNQFHAIKSWCTTDAETEVCSAEDAELCNFLPFEAWDRSEHSHGIDQNTVMHAPPFSLECIVPDFCFLDAVHLHFSKSSSSMKMCVVSSDSDFDLGFDGMCFATPFWLTGC